MIPGVNRRAPAPGDVLAGCELIELAGRGGMGLVFRAVERPLGRTVAVKFLDRDRVGSATARARFRREAEAAASISHPNVLPVYRVEDHDDELLLVMQYAEGGTVYEALRLQGPPPVETTLSIVEQVARALDAAHAQGVVHRDVKPQNLLLGRDGHVWLADFGTACLGSDESAASLTRTGQAVGTVDYMSPEQIRGKAVGPATDVYGLGCVAYRLLTGRVPFPRDGVVARMYGHLDEPVPDPRLLAPALPEGVAEAVMTAMAKEPAERHSSCEAFANALRTGWGETNAGTAGQVADWGSRLDYDHGVSTVDDTGDDTRDRRRLGVLALLVSLGIVCGVGAALATAATRDAAVIGDAGISVEGPPGWQLAPASAAMQTLGVDDEPSLAPDPAQADGVRLVAGALGPVVWPHVLPVGWRAGTAPPVGTSLPVSPGAQGVLWRGVPAGRAAVADAVVVATTRGARGVTCVGPRAATQERDACLAAARLLVIGGALDAVPPVPSQAFAGRLNDALATASRALAVGSARMADARTNAGQRDAAMAMALALGRARTELGGPEPGLTSAHARVAGSLASMRSAADALAAAASEGDGDAWTAAADRLRVSADRLRATSMSLGTKGYSTSTMR